MIIVFKKSLKIPKGGGTTYPSGAHEFTPVLQRFVLLDL
jgi:hypothetical protein